MIYFFFAFTRRIYTNWYLPFKVVLGAPSLAQNNRTDFWSSTVDSDSYLSTSPLNRKTLLEHCQTRTNKHTTFFSMRFAPASLRLTFSLFLGVFKFFFLVGCEKLLRKNYFSNRRVPTNPRASIIPGFSSVLSIISAGFASRAKNKIKIARR